MTIENGQPSGQSSICPFPVEEVNGEPWTLSSNGHLVPIKQIKPEVALREEAIRDLISKAGSLQKQLADFKATAMAVVGNVVSLSAERYEVEIGGKEGNVTLTSFDGTIRVTRSIAKTIAFDEGLQAAKELIDECIRDWSVGAREEAQVLIQDAFRADSSGQLSTDRVLGLRRLPFSDERWKTAMDAIADSIFVTDRKAYIRFHKRNESGGWDSISLDFAKL